jgi:hypothetical protein
VKEVTLPKILKPYQCHDLIRLGKIYDGGYLVNKQDVLNTDRLLSFGIGTDFSFEEQFSKLSNCSVIAYDESDNVMDNSSYETFFQSKNQHIRQNISTTNISEILSYCPKNTFLKCDIEGGEYQILDDLIRHSNMFTGMVLEFHDVAQGANFNEMACFIAKVNLNLVHVHINNYMYYKVDEGPEQQNIPDVFELVFSSSPNVSWEKNVRLPHLFDMPNNPLDTDFSISF